MLGYFFKPLTLWIFQSFLQIHAQFENVQVYFPKNWIAIVIQNIAKTETSLKISVSFLFPLRKFLES